MSTIGHPLSDLANLCLGFHFPEDFPAPIINITQLEPSYGIFSFLFFSFFQRCFQKNK